MPWTNLPTFTVGQVLTASTMNQMRDNGNIGHLICTSVSRPASPDTGQMIYETDTGKLLVYAGGAWSDVFPAPPVGSLVPYAGAAAPSGWLLCDGSAVSRTTYSALFTVLGGASSPYGTGDGSTTFNVPDMRGRAPIGPNSDSTAANTATRSVGLKGGDTRMPTHNHGITDPGHTHTVPYNTGPDTLSGPHTGNYDPNTYGGPFNYTTSSRATGITVNNNGSGTADNMPPFLVVNYIIKA